jgi:hypothetical protein
MTFAVPDRIVHNTIDALDVLLVDDRSHLPVRVRRGGNAQHFQSPRQVRPHAVGDGVLHEQTTAGHAELPGKDRQRRLDDWQRAVEVRVLENDQRCLAT